jgi:glycosyltransferase involved in cell wall biosynthesis
MRILLLRPEVPGVRTGNRLTALRWGALWRQLGHVVRARAQDDDEPADVVVALHAEKCARPLLQALARLPRAVSVLALGGTDLPGPEAGPRPAWSPQAEQALARVDAIVLRHRLQGDGLPANTAPRVRVIGPSAAPIGPRPPASRLRDEVLSLAHLRAIKEPFVLADAMAMLPPAMPLVAVHLGAALDEPARIAAERTMAGNPRWRWLGEWPRTAARQRLRTARAFVLASRSEGSPGAVVEAIVQHVPVLASDIAAHRGLLGGDWPGLFPVGDAAALAQRLQRLFEDHPWERDLVARAAALAPAFAPARERADWAKLFEALDAR